MQKLDTYCERHEALRRRRRTPPAEENIHPALRSQQPIVSTPRTTPRPRQYGPSPTTAPAPPEGANSTNPVSFSRRRAPAQASSVPRRKAVSSRGARESTPPRMFAAMRNVALDLQNIGMPEAYGEGFSPPGGRVRGNLRNVSEIPHIPVLPVSPHRRREQRERSPLVADAGVGQHRSPRSRVRASPVYSEAEHQARLQRQQAVRWARELYEQCERLMMTGRFSREQLLRHRLVQQLSQAERDRLMRDYDYSRSSRDYDRRHGVNHMRTWDESRGGRKSRCAVM